MGYIGKINVAGTEHLVGSTLFGICKSSASAEVKDVTRNTGTENSITSPDYINNAFDNLIRGTTVHIKFELGNTATGANMKLKINTTGEIGIKGNFVCSENSVVSFTYDGTNWVVNNVNLYTFSEGTGSNGTFSVNYNGVAQSVSIHGLNDAAYRGVITNVSGNTTSTGLPTAQAVADYVASAVSGGIGSLTGPMHFIGIATVAVTDGGHEDPTIQNYDFGTDGANATDGDVIIYGTKEFVWVGSAWEELGDEGAYIYKSVLTTAGDIIYASAANTPTRLGIGNNGTFLTVDNGAPAWAAISKTSIGLGNVTNDAQVKALTWDSTNKKITYTIGSTTTDLLQFTAGSNITLDATTTSGVINIIASDSKVTQGYSSSENTYPLLFSAVNEISSIDSRGNQGALVTNSVYVIPSTGTIQATNFVGNGSGLTNVTASSVAWANITDAPGIAGSNLGLVKTTSTVTNFGDYTVAPIDSTTGVIYYQRYKALSLVDVVDTLTVTHTISSTTTSANLTTSATALGVVDSGVLYIKSMYIGTTSVASDVTVDTTSV